MTNWPYVIFVTNQQTAGLATDRLPGRYQACRVRDRSQASLC
jgi:hypothetical protein